MKKQFIKYIGVFAFTFIAVNCAVITVNVYFPSEAVEKAAEKIIDEIEGEDESQGKDSPQSSFRINVPGYVLGNSTVYAEEIDLEITTPAIRKLIDSMKTRNVQVMNYKDKGILGESYDAMLIIRTMDGLGGEEIRTVKRLLRAENADREKLYGELAKANDISLAEVGKIKTIFAKTRKSKAKPGHWFKDEKGKWSQK